MSDQQWQQRWRALIRVEYTQAFISSLDVRCKTLASGLNFKPGVKQHYSLYEHDKVFEAKLDACSKKWEEGSSANPPHDAQTLRKAVRWAILSTNNTLQPTMTAFMQADGCSCRGSHEGVDADLSECRTEPFNDRTSFSTMQTAGESSTCSGNLQDSLRSTIHSKQHLGQANQHRVYLQGWRGTPYCTICYPRHQ